jgi:hypothetical protein
MEENPLLDDIKKFVDTDSWLSLLDDAQLIKIFDMLKSGTTNSEIIKTCQYIYNIKRKTSVHEMLPDLVRFRTKALDDKSLLKLEEAQKNEAALALGSRLRNLTSKVDAFGRLSWLTDQQTLRVMRLLERESKTLPMDITTTNIKMLDQMLHSLLKAQHELNLGEEKTGITQDAAQKVKGLVEGFKDDSETMIQATSKLLELCENRSLILKLEEDGTYAVDERQKVKN